MKKWLVALLGIDLLLGATQLPVCAQDSTLSPSMWREDLDYLIEQLEAVHPDPYARVGEQAFRERAAALGAAMEQRTDAEIAIGLMRLVASLQDGHTHLEPTGPYGFGFWFPVHFYHFSDGLYVTLMDRTFGQFAGARVLRIGQLEAREAHRLAATLKGADNTFGQLENVHYLSNASALHALGIIESPEELPLLVETRDGSQASITLRAFERPFDLAWQFWGEMFGPINGEDNRTRYVSAFDGLLPLQFRDRIETLPLHLRNRIPYWFEYLDEQNAVYMQFNFVERAWRGETFPAFYQRMFAFADSVEADYFVLDLRYNSGGDGSILTPFLHEFIKRERINRRGHLIALVGRKTFSAAVMLFDYLKDHTHTLFVGEPPGAARNHYGDATSVTLPNSQYRLNISTLYHQLSTSADTTRIEPIHLPAPFSGEDYFSGRDPALEVVLAQLPYLPLTETLRHEGGEIARTRFEEQQAEFGDYAWWRPFSEDVMNDLGYELLAAARTADAVAAFEMNAAVYPDSWNVWDSLAEAYLARGDEKLAIETYERSLALNPHNMNAQHMIEQIRQQSDH